MKSTLFLGLIFTMIVSVSSRVGRPGPHAIVYKMKADYSKYVPVNLSDDKSKIVSYPAPQDIYTDGKLALPTPLPHGFWLDNRGIGPNSCFVKITYEEYAKLPQSPSPDDLYKLIIDKDPFTEMYDLGLRNTLKDGEICQIVKRHKLKEYKKIQSPNPQRGL